MTSRIEEIEARQDAIRAELAEIAELTEPTDEDVARTDGLLDENDTLGTELAPLVARAQRVEAVRAAAANPRNVEPAFHAPAVVTRTDPFENVAALRFDQSARSAPELDSAVVSRAVTALTDYRPAGVSDDALQSAVRAVESIPGAAQHALIHGSPAYRSGFKAYLKSQGQNPLYTAEEADAVRTAMSLTGANGGYTLPTLLDPTLIHTGTASKNPLRQLARIVSGTQNVWHGVTVNNVTTYWKAEAAAFTEGSPTLSNPSITAAMLTAYLTASYEIFEDSDLQSQLPGLIGEAFDFAESDAFVVGSGSTAPKGIITAISATAASTVTATTRGSFTVASSVDVFAVVNAVPSRYEDSASWLANKATFNIIQQMSTTGGQGSLYWTDLNHSSPASLLGSSVNKSSAMSAATTSGTVLAILGDFSQFVIYDRVGTSVEYMQNVVDGNGLPTGQRGLVAHKRVGSDCTDLNAFRFLKT
jgi:HK97 family phage major capsid protein